MKKLNEIEDKENLERDRKAVRQWTFQEDIVRTMLVQIDREEEEIYKYILSVFGSLTAKEEDIVREIFEFQRIRVKDSFKKKIMR